MSVYIVNKSTIDVLVTAAAKRGMVPLTRLAAYGQKLYDANVNAFNYRYATSPRVAPFKGKLYRYSCDERDNSAIRDAIEEFTYQCEDLPGWINSEAEKFIRALNHSLNVVAFGMVA